MTSAIFSISPVAGVVLPGTPTSAAAFTPGTKVFGSDGREWLYCKAKSALGSAAHLLVVAGQQSAAATADAYPSASSVASAALGNYVAKHAGGIAISTFFWARAGDVGALT